MVGVFAVVWLADDPTFDVLGPWLESLGGWQRAGVGALVGAAAASPSALYMVPRIWRWARIPVRAFVVSAGAWVLTVWLPPRNTHDWRFSQATFRAQADWYIPASVVAFLGVLVAVQVLWFRADRRRSATVLEEHLAAVRRDLAQGRRRRGR
ncbi:hypothetical protein DQ239_00420 [Blastococcus sp. TF02-09]|nr:hypothetical protein DQ239_00420 [Blastococcus sp. TF02-9]